MSDKKLTAACHCARVLVEVEMSRDTADYVPRACDCDFCQMHGAAYVSDPHGTLTFRTNDRGTIRRYRQGAELADMLFCRHCGVLLGVVFEDPASVYGAVNARLFFQQFGEPATASPKTLGPTDKVERWKKLWFSGVRIA